MALTLIAHGDKLAAIGYDSTTGESGLLQKRVNKAGRALAKGEIVAVSPDHDNAITVEISGFDPIGIAAEAIADNATGWVWKNGSTAQVLMKDETAAVRGYVALCDDVDGRAYGIAVPTSTPATAEHFREIGHFNEAKDAGTNLLALVDLHFN